MIHLVLDHSALIPCGGKPPEEKEAIKRLGEELPRLDVVWHVSRDYLKTLHTVLPRALKGHHPLPTLQSSLIRISRLLLGQASTRAWWCRWKTLAESVRLRVHVVARSAWRLLDSEASRELEALAEAGNLSGEDVETIALAVVAAKRVGQVYLVATDRPLLKAAAALAESLRLGVEALTPTRLEGILR